MKRAAVVVGALLLIALVMALRGPSGEPDKAGDVQPGASDAPDAPDTPAEDAQSPSAVSDESVADTVAPKTGAAGTSASSTQGVDGESAAAATAEDRARNSSGAGGGVPLASSPRNLRA